MADETFKLEGEQVQREESPRVVLDAVVSRLVVAYGGGKNSTALLVELQKRAIKPDLILFADTGGERPETYNTVQQVSAWCVAHDMPEIVTVRANGPTLEQDCITRHALPSIAYGRNKTCSLRWKMQPQDSYLKTWLHPDETYRKAIGYDVHEWHRMRTCEDPHVILWYPLVEWKITREQCEIICNQAGLPCEKSSCFFCPSMKGWEITRLAKQHPELAERAIAMERNAELETIRGLGRNFSWEQLLDAESRQENMNLEPAEIACECYDG